VLQYVTHLVKSQDWWNDYQAHKLREKIFQVEVDNLNNTLNQLSISAGHPHQDIYKRSQNTSLTSPSCMLINQLLLRLQI